MNVKTLCLAILYFQEATGYEIRKLSTEGKYSHFVDASYGSIYPALNRLERDGLVTCREEIEPGKHTRKIYAITEAGRAEFLDSLTEPPGKDVFRSEFLMIAMCAEFLPPAVVRRAIETRVKQLQAEIQLLSGFAENDTISGGIRWAASYGLDCMQNSLNHLSANRAALEGLAGLQRGTGPASTARTEAAE